MTWDDTLGNMKTLDAWRAQIGLTYEAEKLEKLTKPLGGKPIAFARKRGKMMYGKFPGSRCR